MIEPYKNQDALVLTSGGMDSTTCLFWAKKTFNKIYAISFNYGQKHLKEIDAARNLCTKLKINHKIVDISFMKDIL